MTSPTVRMFIHAFLGSLVSEVFRWLLHRIFQGEPTSSISRVPLGRSSWTTFSLGLWGCKDHEATRGWPCAITNLNLRTSTNQQCEGIHSNFRVPPKVQVFIAERQFGMLELQWFTDWSKAVKHRRWFVMVDLWSNNQQHYRQSWRKTSKAAAIHFMTSVGFYSSQLFLLNSINSAYQQWSQQQWGYGYPLVI